MKHGVFALALLMIAAAPVWAQQRSSAPEQHEQIQQRIDEIKDRLALTPEQIEQMRPVLEDELRMVQAVRQKYGGSAQSRRTALKMARELKDIQSSTDERLRNILTKQQMEELQTIRNERRARLRGRAGR